MLRCVRLFATRWAVAGQAPLSMEFCQSRILEWVAIPFSRHSSQPRDQTQVSSIAGGLFTVWVTREAQALVIQLEHLDLAMPEAIFILRSHRIPKLAWARFQSLSPKVSWLSHKYFHRDCNIKNIKWDLWFGTFKIYEKKIGKEIAEEGDATEFSRCMCLIDRTKLSVPDSELWVLHSFVFCIFTVVSAVGTWCMGVRTRRCRESSDLSWSSSKCQARFGHMLKPYRHNFSSWEQVWERSSLEDKARNVLGRNWRLM